MLRGAAGIGVAGLAAGAFAGALAVPADAATKSLAADDGESSHDGPLTVYVRNVRAGEIEVLHGTAETRFVDHELAARLARAAR